MEIRTKRGVIHYTDTGENFYEVSDCAEGVSVARTEPTVRRTARVLPQANPKRGEERRLSAKGVYSDVHDHAENPPLRDNQTPYAQSVVLLHGNGEDLSLFDGLCPLLKNSRRVIAVDSPGHGGSFPLKSYGYYEMADDIAEVITLLNLDKPALFGFSDGGILGLIIAYKYPELLSKLIAAGANLNPRGVKCAYRRSMQISHFFRPKPLYKLMLTGPDIRCEELAKIKIPVLVAAGGRDMIKRRHTEAIASAIPSAQLKILPGETHSGYVKDGKKLYGLIKGFLD